MQTIHGLPLLVIYDQLAIGPLFISSFSASCLRIRISTRHTCIYKHI